MDLTSLSSGELASPQGDLYVLTGDGTVVFRLDLQNTPSDVLALAIVTTRRGASPRLVADARAVPPPLPSPHFRRLRMIVEFARGRMAIVVSEEQNVLGTELRMGAVWGHRVRVFSRLNDASRWLELLPRVGA